MTQMILRGVLAAAIVGSVVGGIAEAATKKVAICHHPPGNPDNAQTISVGEEAVPAHLKHGDHLGECPTGCQVNASLCDDGNACTSDVCLPNGQCEHAPINCDDGNPCTTDLCEETTGCLNLPVSGTACDDGNACTSADTCRDGKCQGTPVLGCCAADADCDDGNPCTIDACVGQACSNQRRDCSTVDKCLAGFCDPTTGQCGTAPVDCNDSNVCTDDSCDPAVGCVHQPTSHPPETRETSCADGVDNDCDGLIDLADPDCASTIPCDPGFADCNNDRVDGCEANLASDNRNCGLCGNMCQTGTYCGNGQCACVRGLTNCNNVCVDLLTSIDNCGACANVCPRGRSCVNGQCL